MWAKPYECVCPMCEGEGKILTVGYGVQLKAVLFDKEMTMDTLAREAGVNVMTVQRIASGEVTKPQENTLSKILAALGMTKEQLQMKVVLECAPSKRTQSGFLQATSHRSVTPTNYGMRQPRSGTQFQPKQVR